MIHVSSSNVPVSDDGGQAGTNRRIFDVGVVGGYVTLSLKGERGTDATVYLSVESAHDLIDELQSVTDAAMMGAW